MFTKALIAGPSRSSSAEEVRLVSLCEPYTLQLCEARSVLETNHLLLDHLHAVGILAGPPNLPVVHSI